MPVKKCRLAIHEFDGGEKMIVCERVHIRHQDEVEWICEQNRPFAVDFGRDTPFEHDEKYHAKKNNDVPPSASNVKSRGNKFNEPKVVKYSLAVYHEGSGEVLVEDPEIIIDP